MSSQQCSVRGCLSASGDVSFFDFPQGERQLETWVEFCARGKYWKPNKNSQVCALHFSRSDFRLSTMFHARRPALKVNACPSIKVAPKPKLLSCDVDGCKSIQKGQNETISFHEFPSDPATRLSWVKFCGKPATWEPNEWSRICSEHFTSNQFLEKSGGRSSIVQGFRDKDKLSSSSSKEKDYLILASARPTLNGPSELKQDADRPPKITAKDEGSSPVVTESKQLRNSTPKSRKLKTRNQSEKIQSENPKHDETPTKISHHTNTEKSASITTVSEMAFKTSSKRKQVAKPGTSSRNSKADDSELEGPPAKKMRTETAENLTPTQTKSNERRKSIPSAKAILAKTTSRSRQLKVRLNSNDIAKDQTTTKTPTVKDADETLICAIFNCTNNAVNKRGSIEFHPFPENESLLQKWLQFCGREAGWKPDNKHRICSKHFIPGEACPSLFAGDTKLEPPEEDAKILDSKTSDQRSKTSGKSQPPDKELPKKCDASPASRKEKRTSKSSSQTKATTLAEKIFEIFTSDKEKEDSPAVPSGYKSTTALDVSTSRISSRKRRSVTPLKRSTIKDEHSKTSGSASIVSSERSTKISEVLASAESATRPSSSRSRLLSPVVSPDKHKPRRSKKGSEIRMQKKSADGKEIEAITTSHDKVESNGIASPSTTSIKRMSKDLAPNSNQEIHPAKRTSQSLDISMPSQKITTENSSSNILDVTPPIQEIQLAKQSSQVSKITPIREMKLSKQPSKILEPASSSTEISPENAVEKKHNTDSDEIANQTVASKQLKDHEAVDPSNNQAKNIVALISPPVGKESGDAVVKPRPIQLNRGKNGRFFKACNKGRPSEKIYVVPPFYSNKSASRLRAGASNKKKNIGPKRLKNFNRTYEKEKIRKTPTPIIAANCESPPLELEVKFSCAVLKCNSTSANSDPSVTFYSFPKKDHLLHKWIVFCNKGEQWKPGSNARICSKHFEPGEVLPTIQSRERVHKSLTHNSKQLDKKAKISSHDHTKPIALSFGKSEASPIKGFVNKMETEKHDILSTYKSKTPLKTCEVAPETAKTLSLKKLVKLSLPTGNEIPQRVNATQPTVVEKTVRKIMKVSPIKNIKEPEQMSTANSNDQIEDLSEMLLSPKKEIESPTVFELLPSSKNDKESTPVVTKLSSLSDGKKDKKATPVTGKFSSSEGKKDRKATPDAKKLSSLNESKKYKKATPVASKFSSSSEGKKDKQSTPIAAKMSSLGEEKKDKHLTPMKSSTLTEGKKEKKTIPVVTTLPPNNKSIAAENQSSQRASLEENQIQKTQNPHQGSSNGPKWQACEVEHCTHNSLIANNSVMFHPFPLNPEKRSIWIAFCQRHVDWEPNNLSRICSNHFRVEDYAKVKLHDRVKKVLKFDALPSIFETDTAEVKPNSLETIQKSASNSSFTDGNLLVQSSSNLSSNMQQIYKAQTLIIPVAKDRSLQKTEGQNSNEVEMFISPDDIKEEDIDDAELDFFAPPQDFDTAEAEMADDYQEEESAIVSDRLFDENKQLKEEVAKQNMLIATLKAANDDLRKNHQDQTNSLESLKKKNSILEESQNELCRRIEDLENSSRNPTEKELALQKQAFRTQILESPLGKVLTENQIDLLLENKKRVQWTKSEIWNAFKLRYFSKNAYIYEHVKSIYPLPMLATIQRYAQRVKLYGGILTDVLEIMSAVGKTLTPKERVTVLVYDSMLVQPAVEYDPERDEILGPYNEVHVVMARGLFSDWKQPIYVDFDQRITVASLQEIVTELHNISFDVVAMVNDCTQNKLNLLLEMGVSGKNTYFSHPCTDKKILCFFDTPRLLEMLRLALITKGFTFLDGTEMTKEPLIRLQESGPYIFADGLLYMPDENMLNSANSELENPTLAIDLFSNTIALLLRKFSDRESIILSGFTESVSKWFQIMTSTNLDESDQITITYKATDEQDVTLNKTFDLVKSLRCIETNRMQIFQEAMLISIRSLQCLQNEMLEAYGERSLLVYKLNQNLIDVFFKHIQNNCNVNNGEFVTGMNIVDKMRAIIFGISQEPSNNSILFSTSEVYLTIMAYDGASLKPIIRERSVDEMLFTKNSTLDPDIMAIEIEQNGKLVRLMEYLIEKHRKQFGAGEDNFSRSELNNALTYLNYSNQMKNFCSMLEKCFRQANENGEMAYRTNVLETLTDHAKDIVNVHLDVIKSFLLQRILLRLRYLNLSMTVEDSS